LQPYVDGDLAVDASALLDQAAGGDSVSLNRLMPLCYGELRRLASAYIHKEGRDHTLQATALVHEAYLRLIGQKTRWRSKALFFMIAAQMMRRVLVDYVRTRKRAKRGGGRQAVSLEDVFLIADIDLETVVALDEALERLERMDPRQCKVVELRYFLGLSVEEAAKTLETSERSVKRDWNLAKAWLYGELKEQHGIRPRTAARSQDTP
jgi:RNA polymerase sigma-70 factor (ECF subfamily)